MATGGGGRRHCCCTFRIQNKVTREFLAEFLGKHSQQLSTFHLKLQYRVTSNQVVNLTMFLGTTILVIIGNGSIAQSVLSLNTKGNFFSVNFGWSVGIFLGVLISGGVSGGHLNPAITVALAMVGRISWRRIPHYLLAQYLGALLGGALVFLIYWDALAWYEHHHGSYRCVDYHLVRDDSSLIIYQVSGHCYDILQLPSSTPQPCQWCW